MSGLEGASGPFTSSGEIPTEFELRGRGKLDEATVRALSSKVLDLAGRDIKKVTHGMVDKVWAAYERGE